MLDCMGNRAKHHTNKPKQPAYRRLTLGDSKLRKCHLELYYTKVTHAIGSGITWAGGRYKPKDSRRSRFTLFASIAREIAS